MKVSLKWLQNCIDLSDKTSEEIEYALTMIGFEVEGIDEIGLPRLENVVVGEVLSYEQHPNADRLRVCQVKVDEGQPRNIVCGARNFKEGDRIIVALPGATLPGDFKIKKSKLRGVVSEGMCCSERELGLGDDHEGIAILKGRPEVGTPINEVYTDSDTVFDIEVTPNRPDALSHIGIARDLGAYFRRTLQYPAIEANPEAGEGGHLVKEVRSDTPENCPHYRGYSIKGVTIAPSPDWLQRRLRAIGLRPINNVVDCTNYVLHELGQPLHAFDAGKIKGGKIIVRQARPQEKITTLDEKDRVLTEDMTVIADAERALVIAGVMGSLDAEVDDSTVDVFLESAYFNPSSTRRTARRLGLSTDSSYRFERGVDPRGAEFAALRCIDLIQESAGGTLMGPPLVAGNEPVVEKEIELDPAFVRRSFGFEIGDQEIEDCLSALELEVVPHTEDKHRVLRVRIPSFRLDLNRPIDLVEEVLRIHGTDKIPSGEVRAVGLLYEDDPVAEYVRAANRILTGAGYDEVMHYSMRSEAEILRWYGHVPAHVLSLTNPLASDASHLRTSLLPCLLDSLALNRARLNRAGPVFETGRVFRERNGRVYEMVSVAFALPRKRAANWLERPAPDYFQTATLLADLLRAAGCQVESGDFSKLEHDDVWQEGHAARIGGFEEGWEGKCGLLNLAMTEEWGVEGGVYGGALFFLPEFLGRPRERARYQPFSAFPPATRDLALIVDNSVLAGDVGRELVRIAGDVPMTDFSLESVRPFDVYEGKGVGEGKRSIAFSLVFRSLERTLKDKEVNAAFDAIQKVVEADERFVIRK